MSFHKYLLIPLLPLAMAVVVMVGGFPGMGCGGGGSSSQSIGALSVQEQYQSRGLIKWVDPNPSASATIVAPAVTPATEADIQGYEIYATPNDAETAVTECPSAALMIKGIKTVRGESVPILEGETIPTLAQLNVDSEGATCGIVDAGAKPDSSDAAVCNLIRTTALSADGSAEITYRIPIREGLTRCVAVVPLLGTALQSASLDAATLDVLLVDGTMAGAQYFLGNGGGLTFLDQIAGDFNGDGFDDGVFARATMDATDTYLLGDIMVSMGNANFFGADDAGSDATLSTLPTPYRPDIIKNIDAAADNFGYASGLKARDVDGDGIDDLIVMTRNFDPIGADDAGTVPNRGLLQVLYGTPDDADGTVLFPAAAESIFLPAAGNDETIFYQNIYFGNDAEIGNFVDTAQGFTDIAAGAFGATNPARPGVGNCGALALIAGDGTRTGFVDEINDMQIIYGLYATELFGEGLQLLPLPASEGASEMDDWLVVRSMISLNTILGGLDDNTGAVYLFHPETLAADPANSFQADIVILGTTEDGFLGTTIRQADINGDGYTDLVLSAPSTTLPRVFLLSGKWIAAQKRASVTDDSPIYIAAPQGTEINAAFAAQIATDTGRTTRLLPEGSTAFLEGIVSAQIYLAFGFWLPTGDVNNDGIVDVLFSNATSSQFQLLLGNAGGEGGSPFITIDDDTLIDFAAHNSLASFDSLFLDAHDWDGDGIADILSTWVSTTPGGIFDFYYGRSEIVSATEADASVTVSAADFSRILGDTPDHSQPGIAFGDFNGDRFIDALIGDPSYYDNDREVEVPNTPQGVIVTVH